ncbi:hypothetical protein [Streptomyces sp. NPDC090798]|uniref:hypothetical protein n=1 Tax=Streptomyces sp. NPDC090798 TaxID=3365968 RepID=UPI00380D367E
MTVKRMTHGGGEPDLVLLVHGTFAGNERREEQGDRWWQRGSTVWRALEENLPPGTQLPAGETMLFQWSGANAQIARLSASNELLARLIHLERSGRKYHLVGHSHGGSIIWEALVTSQLVRKSKHVSPSLLDKLRRRGIVSPEPHVPLRSKVPEVYFKVPPYEEIQKEICLNGLLSWTTLGTPFLQFHHKRRFLDRRRLAAEASTPSASTVLGALLMGFFALMAIGFVSVGLVSRFDHSMRRLPVWLMVVSFCLFMVLWRLGTGSSIADALEARAKAAREAMSAFHGRWLGLWAPDDEAIGLLKDLSKHSEGHYEALCTGSPAPSSGRDSASRALWYRLTKVTSKKGNQNDLQGDLKSSAVDPDLLRRLEYSEPYAAISVLTGSPLNFRFAWIGAIFFPFLSPAIWIANKLLVPRALRWFRGYLARQAQGNNVPGAFLAYCSTSPLPVSGMPAGLPQDVADELQRSIIQTWGVTAPSARSILVRALMDGALPREPMGGGGSDFLVHTAYVSNSRIIRLIGAHISLSRAGGGDGHLSHEDDEHDWVIRTKEAIAEAWAEHTRNTIWRAGHH